VFPKNLKVHRGTARGSSKDPDDMRVVIYFTLCRQDQYHKYVNDKMETAELSPGFNKEIRQAVACRSSTSNATLSVGVLRESNEQIKTDILKVRFFLKAQIKGSKNEVPFNSIRIFSCFYLAMKVFCRLPERRSTRERFSPMLYIEGMPELYKQDLGSVRSRRIPEEDSEDGPIV